MSRPQVGGVFERQPAAGVIAMPTDLADQRQVLGVRMQRLPDQLVGDVGSVELGGVDVVLPRFKPSSTARRSTASASSRSRGGPNAFGPGSCMAPNPPRETEKQPSGKESIR